MTLNKETSNEGFEISVVYACILRKKTDSDLY